MIMIMSDSAFDRIPINTIYQEHKQQCDTIEVSARDQAPQTISGADISYQYLSTGEVLKLLKQQLTAALKICSSICEIEVGIILRYA